MRKVGKLLQLQLCYFVLSETVFSLVNIVFSYKSAQGQHHAGFPDPLCCISWWSFTKKKKLHFIWLSKIHEFIWKPRYKTKLWLIFFSVVKFIQTAQLFFVPIIHEKSVKRPITISKFDYEDMITGSF